MLWMLGIVLWQREEFGSGSYCSQFYANPLFMNPAMAGVGGTSKVYLGYRNQWPRATIPIPPIMPHMNNFWIHSQGGIGVHIINDRQGGRIFNTLSLDAIYAYHLKVTTDLM